MAKGGPEVGNTVPIKDANGNVTGWTTPELALELGIIDAPQEQSGLVLGPGGGGGGQEYIPPTQTTQGGMAPEESMQGFDDGTWNILNPETGQYEQFDQTEDPFFYNPRGDETNWAFDQHGNRVLINTSGDDWESFGAYNPELEGWQLGYQPDGRYGTLPGTTPPPTTQPPPPTTQPPPPTTQPPGTAPPYTPPPAPPGVDKPTDDWFWTDPVGYENAPQPDGDGEFVEGGPPPDTSWDWSFFRDRAPGDRQWGGYDEDYQAFERYIPGMESPWGLPNVAGGNKDFYQQQFLNQLRDEQGYQNRERAAQLRRYEASLPENQQKPITADEMWSWAYGNKGLPGVNLGGNAPETRWELSNAFTPGETTNRDVLQYFQQKDAFQSEGDQKRFRNWLANDPGMQPDSGANFWARAGSPQEIINRLPTDKTLDPANYDWISRMAKAMYNEGQMGPVAPTNYATPIGWGSSYPGTGTGG